MDGFALSELDSWPLWLKVAFPSVILLGLQILAALVPFVCKITGVVELPLKNSLHLDKLDTWDLIYINCNKLLTILFVFNLIQVCVWSDSIKLDPSEATLYNTFGSLFCFYIFYDFFYMWFHRILHWNIWYSVVHKHHHRQKAPSRGNLDAINVHPFEFLVGEYLHILTIYVIPCHIYAVVVFILAAGILASLNHTRYNVKIPGFFTVDAHDVHHREVEKNFAQYTMYWDRLHRTYLDYTDYPVKL